MRRTLMPRRWTIGMLTILLIAISLSWAAEKTPGTSATAPSSGAEASKPSAAPASPEAERGESEQEADTDSSSGPERHGRGDKVAIGEDLDIPEGLSVPGDAVCVGGTLKLAGRVAGDVVVVGGRLEMTGSAGGAVVGVVSKLRLAGSAEAGGDLVNVAGSLDRDEDARIGGKVVDLGWGMGRWFPRWSSPFGLFGFIMFWSTLLKLVLLFLGLLLMAAFVPERVRLISEEAPLRPFMAFLAGLGAYIALVVVMVLFCITIIGIPVAILLYFVFVVLKWLGLAGLFHQIGRRLGRLFNLDLSLLPAVLLGFAPFALLRFLPFCIGTFIWLVLGMVAIGLLILTRAGGRPYPAAYPPLSRPPVAPPPAPPTAAVGPVSAP